MPKLTAEDLYEVLVELDLERLDDIGYHWFELDAKERELYENALPRLKEFFEKGE